MDERILHHLKGVDEIWHAGDVGDPSVIEQLEQVAPVRAVYGNIDSQKIRVAHPEIQDFEIEGLKVFMIHIGGHTKRFAKGVKEELKRRRPDVFISGHSHILKVVFDKELNLLHLNPGAAGKSGFHKMRTMLLFDVDGQVKNLRVVELGVRG